MSGRAKKLRAGCIQNNAGSDIAGNLKTIDRLLHKACLKKIRLLALPEMFVWRGPSSDLKRIAAEVSPQIIRRFSKIACENKIAMLLGSVLEISPAKNRFFNTSVLISETGEILARYRKLHLFDVGLPQIKIKESGHIRAGDSVISAKVWGVRFGLSICYDLRFPELYRQLALQGCRILFVPANFTRATGMAHWEILLRARAIENQAYIVAPGQSGIHPSTQVQSYGNSLLIDPWGTVLSRGSLKGEELIWADLDLRFQDKLRQRFPVLRHARLL